MQSADFEDDVFKRWFRRPSVFTACAWFLLAAAGRVIAPGVVALGVKLVSLALPRARFDATWIAELIYKLVFMAFPVLNYALRRPGVEKSMRLNAPSPLALAGTAAWALACAGFSACVSELTARLIEGLGGALSTSVAIPETTGELAAALAIYALLPGVCEELLFRGGMLGAWERRGARDALLITSALFCALHGSVQGAPVQLAMGLALGYVVIAGDSLYLGMAFHALFNAATLLLAYSAPKLSVCALITRSYASLCVSAVGFGALAIGVCALISPLLWRGRDAWAVFSARGDRTPLDWTEVAVLGAGVITAATLFIEDALRICGVL